MNVMDGDMDEMKTDAGRPESEKLEDNGPERQAGAKGKGAPRLQEQEKPVAGKGASGEGAGGGQGAAGENKPVPDEDYPPGVADGGTPVPGSKLSKEELNWLRRNIVKALKTVRDPEIPVDIYELGLVYIIDIDDEKNVRIDMTLTAPGCPVAGEMPRWVHDAVAKVRGVKSVGVNMVFDPPWSPELMTDEARLELGMF